MRGNSKFLRTETHLVNIVVRQCGVEHRVEVVEQVDYFHGIAVRGDGGEADNVGEINCDIGETLRLHRLAQFQLFRHSSM